MTAFSPVGRVPSRGVEGLPDRHWGSAFATNASVEREASGWCKAAISCRATNPHPVIIPASAGSADQRFGRKRPSPRITWESVAVSSMTTPTRALRFTMPSTPRLRASRSWTSIQSCRGRNGTAHRRGRPCWSRTNLGPSDSRIGLAWGQQVFAGSRLVV